jgi:DNA end-binding protein Ku
MPQATWTGTLSFGLVSIPVKLYGATSPRDVRFHQFEGRSGRRVRYRRVANEDDMPLWEPTRQAKPQDIGDAPGWPRDERTVSHVPPAPSPQDTPADEAPSDAPVEPEPAEPHTPMRPVPREAHDRPGDVAFEDVVRGFEVDPGRFIRVTAEDLERFAPEQDRTIKIEDFVQLSDIDPVFFEKSYHLVPARGGEKTYRLLVRAMEEAGYVAIGRFVLRTREHVAAVRPSNGALVLETLFRADEVRSPDELGLRTGEEPSERELAVAVRLIEALATEWDPARYPDDYRERVLEMIRTKAGPAPDVAPTPELPGEEPPVYDLMEALKKSVEEARKARRAEESKSTKQARPGKHRRSG